MALFGHPSLYLLYDLCKINNSKSLDEFGGHSDVSRILFSNCSWGSFLTASSRTNEGSMNEVCNIKQNI